MLSGEIALKNNHYYYYLLCCSMKSLLQIHKPHTQNFFIEITSFFNVKLVDKPPMLIYFLTKMKIRMCLGEQITI